MTSPRVTEAMNDARSGFFYRANEVRRRHVHNRFLTHTLAFTHIWWNTKAHTCTSTQAYACHVGRLSECRSLREHANMLPCQRDAYCGCLWRWKLTFSMVLSLMGGDDGDYKSTWSAYSVMAYYTPFYCGFVLAVIAIPHHCIDTHAQTHTQLAYKSQPHSCLCCLSPAHAECVMSGAWVRLRQILCGVGGLVSLWASVLRRSALQCFCWRAEWPAGSPLLASCHLS